MRGAHPHPKDGRGEKCCTGFTNSGNIQPQEFLLYEIKKLPCHLKKKSSQHRPVLLQTVLLLYPQPKFYWDNELKFLCSSTTELHGCSLLSQKRKEAWVAGCGGAGGGRLVGCQVVTMQAFACLITAGGSCLVSHFISSLLINQTIHANCIPWQFTYFRSFMPHGYSSIPCSKSPGVKVINRGLPKGLVISLV